MRIVLLLTLTAAFLTGCGLGSGVVPLGSGIYGITEMRAPVRGGGPEARRAVLAEAAAFCRRAERHVIVLDLRPGGDPRLSEWPTAFGLTFGCG